MAILDDFVENVSAKYEVGTILHGLETFSLFELCIIQLQDGMNHVSGEEKLYSLHPHPISRLRRKNLDERINAGEHIPYCSLNRSLPFIDLIGRPFCAVDTSYLQPQKITQ